MLLEIALIVKQSDGHKRYAQSAGAFDMVAGKHAQAAGINRHRFVNAELQRKIGHRLGAQHAAVSSTPTRSYGNIFFQPSVSLIYAAIEHQFGRPHFQAFGRKFR